MAKKIDFLGTKIGHLAVKSRIPRQPGNQGGVYWRCLCECGGETARSSNQLKEAQTSGTKLVCSNRCPYFYQEMMDSRNRNRPVPPTAPARVKKQTVSVPNTPMPTIEPDLVRTSAGNVTPDLAPKTALPAKPADVRTNDPPHGFPDNFPSIHQSAIDRGEWVIVPLFQER